jgi:hypothetical protein
MINKFYEVVDNGLWNDVTEKWFLAIQLLLMIDDNAETLAKDLGYDALIKNESRDIFLIRKIENEEIEIYGEGDKPITRFIDEEVLIVGKSWFLGGKLEVFSEYNYSYKIDNKEEYDKIVLEGCKRAFQIYRNIFRERNNLTRFGDPAASSDE